MKSFLIAAGIAILASTVMVVMACHPHPGDSCYIMQGMSPYIAGVLVIIRELKKPPPDT